MAERKSKSLGQGQLLITPNDIYEVPYNRREVTSQTVINLVTAHNTNAVTQTVVLYLLPRSTTATRIIRRATLKQNETIDLISNLNILHMASGDKLQAETTTASAVDYAIFGEETKG